MIPGVLTALPVVGDLLKAATPLAQPFANVLSKSLGNVLDKTVDKILGDTPPENKNPVNYVKLLNNTNSQVTW